jgi:hypothetical protein
MFLYFVFVRQNISTLIDYIAVLTSNILKPDGSPAAGPSICQGLAVFQAEYQVDVI